MESYFPDRDYAFKILKEHINNQALIRHALAMEAVMRYFAKFFGEEEVEKWGIIGLLHDVDYEKYPDKHCHMVKDLLSPHGFPEEYIRAIESHGYKLTNDIEPRTRLEKVLYATDELTGLISATVILRPSKSIMDLKLKSVKKKWKQKSFATGANREVIAEGAKMLGLDLDTLIEHTIKGMQNAAGEIGLKGQAQ